MEADAIQLLNLSPIPELSEMELNAVLEQISNLSEINSELTDHNMEEILREAEELIERPSTTKLYELESLQQNTNFGNDETVQFCSKNTETKKQISNECVNLSNFSPVSNFNETNVHHNSPALTSDSNKSIKSSPQLVPTPTFLSRSTTNHIKSTINAIEEFSNLIEKRIISSENHTVDSRNGCTTNKKSNRAATGINKNGGSLRKQSLSEGLNITKTSKIQNCFERLYQEQPIRFSTNIKNQKQKVSEKLPDSMITKKIVKDAKNVKVPTLKIKKAMKYDEKITNSIHMVDEELSQKDMLCKTNIVNKEKLGDKCIDEALPNANIEKNEETLAHLNCTTCKVGNELHLKYLSTKDLLSITNNSGSEAIQPKIEVLENIMLNLLQGIKEIKGHVKGAEIVSNIQIQAEMLDKSQGMIDDLKPEVEYVGQRVVSKTPKNDIIRGLEEQLAVLKDKYNYQIEKLESENEELKKALNSRRDVFLSEIGDDENRKKSSMHIDVGLQTEQVNDKIDRNDVVGVSITMVNAFCQTDNAVKNISIQCKNMKDSDMLDESSLQAETKNKDSAFHVMKINNKENLWQQKKSAKFKSFSSNGVSQLIKQKKMISEHEIQLMATIRGMQAEASSKDKENRKLKIELDLLKSQIKKPTKVKCEGRRRSHIGTQTLALGPVVQQTYNSKAFEVANNFEKENEELKIRINALEDSFELLKQKRINDLQSLHQVHEEEMAKLVSKLESQSALTKHLHTLLVKR